ncbi:hypothetical protein ACWERV_19580 [Streptomyces sp. NPDC004031]
MADDNVFAAIPDEVRQGGAVTDEVGLAARQLAKAYETYSAFDPNDPPWGRSGETAKAFQEKYVQPHADLRDALDALAQAIVSAATKTVNSGNGFHNAQSDALDALHGDGGRR